MNNNLKEHERLKITLSSKPAKHDQIQKNEKDEVHSFKFLVPNIPTKSHPNVIPTGKQIPRTPLKLDDTLEISNINKVLSATPGKANDPILDNMIPKGRQIPRTPPVYANLHLRKSGYVAQPFAQVSDLGVAPILNSDNIDETDLNIKEIIKKSNITIRKRPMPKRENFDFAELEAMEDLEPKIKENIPKILLKDEKQIGRETSDGMLEEESIISKRDEKSTGVIPKGRTQRSTRVKRNVSSLTKKDGKDLGSRDLEPDNKEKISKTSDTAVKKNSRKISGSIQKEKSVISENSAKVLSNNRKQPSARRGCTKSPLSRKENKDLTELEMSGVGQDNKENISETRHHGKKKGVQKNVDTKLKGLNAISERDKKSCEVPSNVKKQRGNKGNFLTLSTINENISPRRNPSRRAREGINYKLSP